MLDTLMTYRSKLSTGIFMAMLCLPLLGHLFSSADESIPLENRTLASFPSVANLATDWPGYTSELNAWMEDRVGFRSGLIRLHGELRDAFDLELSTQAVIGDDGWYFVKVGEAMKMHQGLLPFSGGQAEEWLHPEAELLAAKANAQVYYKTDTHWSSAGAFVGYEVLIDAVNQMGFPVDKIDREAQISISENSHKGDIYGLLGLTDEAAETTSEWKLKVPRAFEKELLPDYDWSGFKALRMVARDNEGSSILLLGDSFASALQPFLRESFSEVTFVHHQHGEAAIAALDTGPYDLVVLEMVERSLSKKLELETSDP